MAEPNGWPSHLPENDFLHRLVDLSRARAAEEARGHIRRLRPDFQNPDGRAAVGQDEQGALDVGAADATAKPPFPEALPDQIAAVREALTDLGDATPEPVARCFQRGCAQTVKPPLESLTALGQARAIGNRFAC